MKRSVLFVGFTCVCLNCGMVLGENEAEKPSDESPLLVATPESETTPADMPSPEKPHSTNPTWRPQKDRRVLKQGVQDAEVGSELWLAQTTGRHPDDWGKDQPRKAPPIVMESETSYGKDFTALFRPSRWRRPLAVGGTLSWLNPRAWRSEPYRTFTVLTGEVVFGLAIYYTADALDSRGSGSGRSDPEPIAPSRRSSGGTTDSPSEPGGSNGDAGAGGGIEDF